MNKEQLMGFVFVWIVVCVMFAVLFTGQRKIEKKIDFLESKVMAWK